MQTPHVSLEMSKNTPTVEDQVTTTDLRDEDQESDPEITTDHDIP